MGFHDFDRKLVKKLLKCGLPVRTVDVFATQTNRRLDRYMSLDRDIDSLGDFLNASAGRERCGHAS